MSPRTVYLVCVPASAAPYVKTFQISFTPLLTGLCVEIVHRSYDTRDGMRSWFGRCHGPATRRPPQLDLRKVHSRRHTAVSSSFQAVGSCSSRGRHGFTAADTGGPLEVILVQLQLPPSTLVGDDWLTLEILGTVETITPAEKIRREDEERRKKGKKRKTRIIEVEEDIEEEDEIEK